MTPSFDSQKKASANTDAHITMRAEIAKRDHEIIELRLKVNELQLQLEQSKKITAIVHALFNKVDGSIINRLTRSGKRKKIRSTAHPEVPTYESRSYEELLSTAKDYDIERFFIYKAKLKNPMKLHYRILAKTYRTTRDLGLGTIATVQHYLRKGD